MDKTFLILLSVIDQCTLFYRKKEYLWNNTHLITSKITLLLDLTHCSYFSTPFVKLLVSSLLQTPSFHDLKPNLLGNTVFGSTMGSCHDFFMNKILWYFYDFIVFFLNNEMKWKHLLHLWFVSWENDSSNLTRVLETAAVDQAVLGYAMIPKTAFEVHDLNTNSNIYHLSLPRTHSLSFTLSTVVSFVPTFTFKKF